MARRKLDQKKINEKRKENKLKAFFMDNKKIVKYSLIGLLAISLSAGAISLASRNDNKDKGKVTIESSKESKKETQIEVSKETQEETVNEEEAEKKIIDTNTSQTKENKETKPSKSKDQSKKNITYKYEDKETIIPYKTKRKYNIPNAKTRVKQKGVNGKTINTYKITLEDGKEVSRNITDTKTIKAQDEIIETYVKVQDKKVETREIEDKSKPVYRIIGKERWFVHNDLTGETKYFYSAGEAEDYMTNNRILGNWGTAESEKIKTNEILGYETKTEEVVVQEEKWAWQ